MAGSEERKGWMKRSTDKIALVASFQKFSIKNLLLLIMRAHFPPQNLISMKFQEYVFILDFMYFIINSLSHPF